MLYYDGIPLKATRYKKVQSRKLKTTALARQAFHENSFYTFSRKCTQEMKKLAYLISRKITYSERYAPF